MKDILNQLEDQNSQEHQKILKSSLDLLKISKGTMGGFYPIWDKADMNFRLKRMADEKDANATRRGEPAKQTIPFAYPQILTFVAYCMMIFNQRPDFFEIQGSGHEDERSQAIEGSPEKDAERCLSRDLRKNRFNAILYQLLINLGKFGIGVVKTQWDKKTVNVTVQKQEGGGETVAGQPTGVRSVERQEEKTIYLGNRIDSISPYSFYPDTRLPLTRFQEGEFCASEEEFSLQRLRDDDTLFGLDDIENLSSVTGVDTEVFFTNTRFRSTSTQDAITAVPGNSGMCVVTEMQRWITPNKFYFDEGKSNPLGDGSKVDNRPQLFLIWIVNWKRVVKFEPLNYLHGEFTYAAGQFNNDQIQTINEGLSELLEPMENTASWLLNSRIASVRKNVDARMFVDPSSVEWNDIVERKPVIRMKATARGTIDQWFKQIAVSDVTQNHMQDIQTLWSFSQASSGISENMLGQYSAGRRDATQSKAVASGASGRMKTVATVVWEVLFTPMGEQMLSNLQNGLTLEHFQRIVGRDAQQDRFDAFNKRSEGILGSYDFKFFDGTLPSEKNFTAQTLQELFLGMMSNPQAAIMLQSEPFRSIFVEIAELRQIRNPDRFLPPKLIPSNVTVIPQTPTAQSGQSPEPSGQTQGVSV